MGPGQLPQRSRRSPKLSNRCPNVAPGAQIRPKFADVSARFGPCVYRCWPESVARFGQLRSIWVLGEPGAGCANVRPNPSPSGLRNAPRLQVSLSSPWLCALTKEVSEGRQGVVVKKALSTTPPDAPPPPPAGRWSLDCWIPHIDLCNFHRCSPESDDWHAPQEREKAPRSYSWESESRGPGRPCRPAERAPGPRSSNWLPPDGVKRPGPSKEGS